mmetsp:Transcript_22737/g.35358  ORF Transcript_22737/g.35358 Transcript_22737/m.35358 type:complete len:207 (+) Transcript_22737:2846-3466(+)
MFRLELQALRKEIVLLFVATLFQLLENDLREFVNHLFLLGNNGLHIGAPPLMVLGADGVLGIQKLSCFLGRDSQLMLGFGGDGFDNFHRLKVSNQEFNGNRTSLLSDSGIQHLGPFFLDDFLNLLVRIHCCLITLLLPLRLQGVTKNHSLLFPLSIHDIFNLLKNPRDLVPKILVVKSKIIHFPCRTGSILFPCPRAHTISLWNVL